MESKQDAELLLFGEWLENQEKSKITVKKYIRDVDKFRQFCKKELLLLTKQDVLIYKEHLMAQYKPVTVNSYLISLNRFFTFLDMEALQAKTMRIQKRHSLEEVLTEAECFTLLDAAQKQGKLRLYYLIRVLVSSGIRVGELQYITVGMLKMGKADIYSKAKTREIVLSQNLCNDLRRYCEECGITDVIFHGEKPDTLIDKARIWRELKQLARTAGVPEEKVHAHNFRHLFAKRFIAQFHDIVDLADVLGHSSVETTRIYTRTSGQEKRNRVNLIDQCFSGKPATETTVVLESSNDHLP